MKKIILIGGSDGLGREFAKICVDKGIDIVNIGRSLLVIDKNCGGGQ